MVSEGGSSTDSTPTATDTTSTADTGSTTTDTTPAPTTTDTTPAPTTTDTTPAPTTTDTTPAPATTDTTPAPTTTEATTPTPPASPSPFVPSITSDLADYPPGATVTLTGAAWGAGEAVHIFVNDDVGQTWQYNADVTADASGGFTTRFSLPNYFVANYGVTATGSSGAAATTTFTDAIATTTTLVSSLNPSTVGQSVTFTATVTCSQTCTFGSGNTVNFVENSSANNCNGTAIATGSMGVALTGTGLSRTATFSTSALAVGTHPIRACFNGGGSGTTPGASISDPPLNEVVNAGAAAKLAYTAEPTSTGVNNTINGATGGDREQSRGRRSQRDDHGGRRQRRRHVLEPLDQRGGNGVHADGCERRTHGSDEQLVRYHEGKHHRGRQLYANVARHRRFFDLYSHHHRLEHCQERADRHRRLEHEHGCL
jgi:hypothetical protein